MNEFIVTEYSVEIFEIFLYCNQIFSYDIIDLVMSILRTGPSGPDWTSLLKFGPTDQPNCPVTLNVNCQ